MTFLIMKIAGYLALALAAGAGAGWLLRSRVGTAAPVDSAELIALQERTEQLQEALAQRDERLAGAKQHDVDQERTLSELRRSEQRVQVLESTLVELRAELESAHPAQDEADGLITALHGEIARLRDELSNRDDATEGGRSARELELAHKELEARLVRKAGELDRLEQALSREERKVRELERERELQNKSLHVLHQQLELERERGPRSGYG